MNDLSEKSVDPDPFIQFSIWYNEHLKAGIAIPEAVALATATVTGHVSLRTVLLKDRDEKGFVFFTNYKSKKGIQISENPNAALLFYWPESNRQVRIEGITKKVSGRESDTYFSQRPRESQLSAWASEQSSVIPDRLFLEERFGYFKKKFENKKILRPPHWGGFRIIPDFFEFWHDGAFRLHNRITYVRSKEGWIINRLAP